MSRHQASGADLLRTARRVLKEDLLPELPAERHFEALMVLSAMGMAERELLSERGEGDTGELAAALGLEAEDGASLWRVSVAAIRSGRFDADPQIYELARRALIRRLKETDPRALDPPLK